MASPSNDDDLFSDVLDLEEQFYQEGHALGVADGSASGRIEGRLFGLERGYDKARAAGELYGRALVWKARLPPDTATSGTAINTADKLTSIVPQLNGSDRLRKHIDRLLTLTTPASLPTDNTEDSVSEFDDRLKDARAKSTLITKIVGEAEDAATEATLATANEQAIGNRTLRVKRMDAGKTLQVRGEMEDFAGTLRPQGD